MYLYISDEVLIAGITYIQHWFRMYLYRVRCPPFSTCDILGWPRPHPHPSIPLRLKNLVVLLLHRCIDALLRCYVAVSLRCYSAALALALANDK